ncbi:MAG: hypothetical protein AAF585_29245 [Verrucomicrobiota bacterium]
MRNKTEYRNSLGVGVLAKWFLALAAVGCIACAYVYVRNLHIQEGDFVREAEAEMAELREEIVDYRLKIAGIINQSALEEALVDRNSQLRDIEQSAVRTVSAPRGNVQFEQEVASAK